MYCDCFMSLVLSNSSEGWIQDPGKFWSIHFHRDPKSWSAFPYVFLDQGRAMKDGSPALLKTRRYLPHRDAVAIWERLISEGWGIVAAQWGIDAEP